MRILRVVADIELPKLPNFLRTSDGNLLPVEAITDDGLREIGQAWAAALVAHAQLRRAEAKQQPEC